MSSMKLPYIALGINIDHVATVRQARRAPYPDPVHAALLAEQAGADNITLHLREDRRHIQDRDVHALRPLLQTRMNLEMGLTDEMVEIATGVRPQDCCLVPEKRAEITTEGGLDLGADGLERARRAAVELGSAGIEVSFFLDPDPLQIERLASLDDGVVAGFEINTDAYTRAGAATRRSASSQTVECQLRPESPIRLQCRAAAGRLGATEQYLA